MRLDTVRKKIAEVITVEGVTVEVTMGDRAWWAQLRPPPGKEFYGYSESRNTISAPGPQLLIDRAQTLFYPVQFTVVCSQCYADPCVCEGDQE